MLPVLSTATIVLSLVMVYINAGKFHASVYLGLLFIVISVCCYSQYLVLFSPAFGTEQFLLPITGITAGLVGPSLYFYLKSVLNENSRVGKKDLWHFMPPVFIYIISFMFDAVTGMAIFLLWPLLIMVYVVWMSAKLINFVRFGMERLVFRAQKFIIPWLEALLVVLFLAALSMLFWVLQALVPEYPVFVSTIYFLQNIIMLAITGMAILVFVFPRILYGMPQVPLPWNSPKKPDEYSLNEINTPTDSGAAYKLFIQEKTESFMEKERPWLQAQCNLVHFSKITCIPAHHLACYFKYIKKHDFNNYCNMWRVKYAKSRLLQNKASGLSLQEIGFLSGFSSQRKFFRAFRKAERVSIRAFLSQNYK